MRTRFSVPQGQLGRQLFSSVPTGLKMIDLGLHDTGRKKKAGTAKRKSKKKNAQDTKQGGLF
jgi:hypothetical protein